MGDDGLSTQREVLGGSAAAELNSATVGGSAACRGAVAHSPSAGLPDETEAPKQWVAGVPAGLSDLELLRAFEPVVRYTHGEQFFPCAVEPYLARCSLWARFADGREELLVDHGELDLEKLTQVRELPFGTLLYLRFAEQSGVAESARLLTEVRRRRRATATVFHPGIGRLARGGFLPRIADALFSLSFFVRGRFSPVLAAVAELAYARLLEEDERFVYYGRVTRQGGWTCLQYWFFYFYNNWRSAFHGVNDHEADWENVVVYLYEEDDLLWPEWVAYACHEFQGADLRRRWDDREQLEVIGTHPVVYAGAGSHASYFRPGEYQSVVTLPWPGWIRKVARGLSLFWTRVLGQAEKPRDPFRVPFVDYARGDGRAVGPGQSAGWEPILIDEDTPWVGGYRGLWGQYGYDPIFGENAPAGPMYNRDGSLRRSWHDPVGFAGLEREPPPPLAVELLAQQCRELEARQLELESLIEEETRALQKLGTQLLGLDGHPHLESRHQRLREAAQERAARLAGLRDELAENRGVVAALGHRLELLERGQKTSPRAHLRRLNEPVPCRALRFHRMAETWGAASLSVILFGIVAILVFARTWLWAGLVVLVVAFVLMESVLRGEYNQTITRLAALLAITSSVVLIMHFWLWIIVALLFGLAVFLLVQKGRELRR